MANYAVVKNNEIVETRDVLPNSWKNVSGLNCLSLSELLTLGWYPVVQDAALTYDPKLFKLGAPIFTVRATDVLESRELIKRSHAEIEAMEQVAKNNNIAALRDMRNELLQLTDWTQLNDIPEQMRSAWAEYRQLLRDLMAVYDENYTDDYMSMLPQPPAILPNMVKFYR